LTCSIGIASNKLLAKLGSDMQKPDGLVLISPDDVSEVLENLPVKELCGIGPNLTRHLAAVGIHTCGNLGRAPVLKLISRFGIIGERLRNMGLGLDDDPVEPLDLREEEEAKSIGHSMTLEEDCTDIIMIERHILQLSEKVGRRLRRGLYGGRTVSLTVRYADFHTFSKQRRLRHAVNHGLDIYQAARGLLRETRLLQPVRLVGVSVSSLERRTVEIPLFVDERKRKTAIEAMDEINDRYGEFTVTWGTLAERYRHARIISPAWRPTGDRQY
jgi:DNA polymerase-4